MKVNSTVSLLASLSLAVATPLIGRVASAADDQVDAIDVPYELVEQIFAEGFDGVRPTPVGRVMGGRICYRYETSGISCRQGDYESFDDTFGRYWMNDTLHISDPSEFPGPNYYQSWTAIPGTGYVSSQFTVPLTITTQARGSFQAAETPPVAGAIFNLTASISTAPGDFNPANGACKGSAVRPGGQLVRWKASTAPDNWVMCPLVAGQTYYFNFTFTDASECAGACATALQVNSTR